MRKSDPVPANVIVRHFVMGFVLGGLGALYLIHTNTANLFGMLMGSTAPEITLVAFIVTAAVLIGIAATLTGVVLTVLDDDRVHDR
ncbi:MAG: hypothetical protein IT536_09130 [Hyphomicrobiales bacterium]|nr:hypothetical protein [Hyphomicrobiales bacterium]